MRAGTPCDDAQVGFRRGNSLFTRRGSPTRQLRVMNVQYYITVTSSRNIEVCVRTSDRMLSFMTAAIILQVDHLCARSIPLGDFPHMHWLRNTSHGCGGQDGSGRGQADEAHRVSREKVVVV